MLKDVLLFVVMLLFSCKVNNTVVVWNIQDIIGLSLIGFVIFLWLVIIIIVYVHKLFKKFKKNK